MQDDREHTSTTAGGPTAAQLAATIWGPYRSVPGVDGADQLGRSLAAFTLVRGGERVLAMEPSLSPAWVTDPNGWRRDYAQQPIRLEVACRRDGNTPWQIPMEVDQPQSSLGAEVRHAEQGIRVTCRNTGTAPAYRVRFLSPSNDPLVVINTDEQPRLDIGRSFATDVVVPAESRQPWVELTWVDQLGVPHRQRIDLEDQ